MTRSPTEIPSPLEPRAARVPFAEPFDADRLDRRDPQLIASLLPRVHRINQGYFRLRVEGIENIPRTPAMFVANHNGGIMGPDMACTMATLWTTLGVEAPLYALAHDFAMRHLTPLGRVLQRFGAVRAAPGNAARVLASGGQVLVYPGGDLDAYRHSKRRDEIVLGERTGFIRAAQQAKVPIVPIVAHGAHRSAYIFAEGKRLAAAMRLKHWTRLQRFPLAIALPWGIAVGPFVPYLPLPFAIRLRVLPPMRIAADEDAAAARDRVRSSMQSGLDSMARESR